MKWRQCGKSQTNDFCEHSAITFQPIYNNYEENEFPIFQAIQIRLLLLLYVYVCSPFAAISMIVGCVAFPFGWNSNEFRKICGPESNRFEIGPICGIRWAYPLAIIGNLRWYWTITALVGCECVKNLKFWSSFFHSGCIDACILATLAFILATRHVRLQPEPMYQNSMFKGMPFFFTFLSSFNCCIMLYDIHTIFDIIPKNNHIFSSFRVTLCMYLIIPSMHDIYDDYIQAKWIMHT